MLQITRRNSRATAGTWLLVALGAILVFALAAIIATTLLGGSSKVTVPTVKNLTEQAIHELQSAVDADPKNAAYRLHLAMALLKRGDKTAAKREAATALRTADADQQQKIRTFMNQIS